MGYQITLEIPDGDFCLKITDPYILCPLLICDGNNYFCPFNPDTEPLPEILARTAISKGGIAKQPFCPSRKPVRENEIDFWTYQRLQQIRLENKEGLFWKVQSVHCFF